MHRNYYEAILQLRPGKAALEAFVEKHVAEAGKARIARKKRLKTGVDYYLSSWMFTVALGHLMTRRFGGTVHVTRKLFGRSRKKGGQLVYRCTVLYRSPMFSRGDVVAFDGDVFQVTSVGKGTFIAKNLSTGKKGYIKPDETWQALEKKEVDVSKKAPNLEVISPEDYQSLKVENPGSVSGEKALVVIHNGKAYLVE